MKQPIHRQGPRCLRALTLVLCLAAAQAQAAPPGFAKLPAAALEAPGLAMAQASVAPSVVLDAPADGAVVAASADVTLRAAASDAHSSIVAVDFYAGTTLLGRATAAPYEVTWQAVPAGRYTLTAVATNDRRHSATSAPVGLVVNALPTVSLNGPAAGQVVAAPGNLTLSAAASDTDGSIVKVDFYAGATFVGSATMAPFSFGWNNVQPGTYSLTARATDDLGGQSTSAPVVILVDAPPSVTLTSPPEGARAVFPTEVSLAASAADSDGTVAKVEFFANGSLIGSATAAPYSVPWTPGIGSYSLTARATDEQGVASTSAARSFTVAANQAPSVSLTSPIPGQVVAAPGHLTLTADTADADGMVTQVAFFANGELVGTATAAPYSVVWNDVAAGSFSLTAVARDDKGGVTTSAAVPLVVNGAPTVRLTAPQANANFVAPATIGIAADAGDADGGIIRVDFYAGATRVGTATTAPYRVTWNDVAPGSYTLTAQATDQYGASSTSTEVAISVVSNQTPSVSLTTPTAGQGFTAPASVILTASASDADGSIAQVAFYGNDSLLGTVTTPPYSLTWANLGAGSYTVTALATDDRGGVISSAPVIVTVGAVPARITYLQADHLGTPRLATDSNNTVVWRHDPLTEPFGMAPPEEDPDGDGVPFTLNLRFPGQYFDKETNLAYNYFRDYDPVTGRYVQSDPIGLEGGINTYLYVRGDPLTQIDPLGLANGPAVGWMSPPIRSICVTCIVNKDNPNSSYYESGSHYEGSKRCNYICDGKPMQAPGQGEYCVGQKDYQGGSRFDEFDVDTGSLLDKIIYPSGLIEEIKKNFGK